MRRRGIVRLLVVMPFTVTMSAAGGAEGTLPEKGAVLYVSRTLHSQAGPSGPAGSSTADFVTGRTSLNPISSEDGIVDNASLPACEPVEVRTAKKKSLKVRWLRDRRTVSTLGEHWRNDVHRSQEDCMDAVALRRGEK
jgi:hypothetical protein